MMKTSRRQFLQIGFLTTGCACMSWKLYGESGGTAHDADPQPYRVLRENIRPLFVKKKPAQPGDWLESHAEAGQTFDQYLQINPNRPTSLRKVIYLLPIGTFSEEEQKVAKILREYMTLIFGLEVKFLQRIPLETIPASAQRVNKFSGQRQLLSTYILFNVLKPMRPRDAVAVLALTTADLWPGKHWNFVFGQASLGERVGVWSTARFGDVKTEYAMFFRRVMQVAVHETGHMFGIKHCIAYECCMNGANSQQEGDRAPLVFCPECDAKLWWACQLKPKERAQNLASFAKINGLKAEETAWSAIADALPSDS